MRICIPKQEFVSQNKCRAIGSPALHLAFAFLVFNLVDMFHEDILGTIIEEMLASHEQDEKIIQLSDKRNHIRQKIEGGNNINECQQQQKLGRNWHSWIFE